jgi:hypothetical protein
MPRMEAMRKGRQNVVHAVVDPLSRPWPNYQVKGLVSATQKKKYETVKVQPLGVECSAELTFSGILRSGHEH